MEHLSFQDKLREVGLFRLGKRGLSGDLVTAFQYLKESNRKEVNRLHKEGEMALGSGSIDLG